MRQKDYMDPLSKIFQATNGEVRLKVIRYFLANQDDSYKIDDIEQVTKIKRESLKRDILFLTNLGFLERLVDSKNNSFYQINPNFEYKDTLFDLVFDFKNINKKFILDKFKKIGRIKLFSFTGIFIDDKDVEVDILVVGDNLKEKEINKVVAELNAIFASKLRVMVIDIEEFDYRKKMFDRFLHLILDSNRITLVDKISDRI